MKRFITMCFTVILLLLGACQKVETFGTLEVTVKADTKSRFTLKIYPYSPDYYNGHPIFLKEYNALNIVEKIPLSPGNYIISGSAKIESQGVNIIAGEDTEIIIYL